jgi:hypothetical protein
VLFAVLCCAWGFDVYQRASWRAANGRVHAQELSPDLGRSSVIVAGCKGKLDQVSAAVDTWLTVRGVSSVVLVDWGSSPPYSEYLPPYILDNPKLKLVTVTDQPLYYLTWAINLAVSFVLPGHNIIKLDCDSVVTSDFVESQPLPQGTYYAGDWENARDENEMHLNGIFYIRVEDYNAVGGFDERIQTYGWDDSDLMARLEASGLAYKAFDMNRIHHLFHADSDRTANVPHLSESPHFETSLTRLLHSTLQPWTAADARSRYDLVAADTNSVRATMVKESRVTGVRHQVPPETFTRMFKEASYEALTHLDGFEWAPVIDKLGAEYQARVLNSFFNAEKLSTSKKMLIVHLQHGMGNRLRALASAMVVARKSGRWLRVVCPTDIHFNATLGDLFELQNSGLRDVWDEFVPDELTLFKVDSYDYMDPAQKYASIDHKSKNHIYVRSAYRLNSTLVTAAEEDEALRSLVLAVSVRKLVESVALPEGRPLVTVHVRNLHPKTELAGMRENEYSPQDLQDIVKFRNATKPAAFVAEMKRLAANDSSTAFFVAVDSPASLAEVKTAVPNVLHLSTGGCMSRAADCLQVALAEMVLLGKGGTLLGSYWSSYTEMAACYAGVVPRYAGQDF